MLARNRGLKKRNSIGNPRTKATTHCKFIFKCSRHQGKSEKHWTKNFDGLGASGGNLEHEEAREIERGTANRGSKYREKARKSQGKDGG